IVVFFKLLKTFSLHTKYDIDFSPFDNRKYLYKLKHLMDIPVMYTVQNVHIIINIIIIKLYFVVRYMTKQFNFGISKITNHFSSFNGVLGLVTIIFLYMTGACCVIFHNCKAITIKVTVLLVIDVYFVKSMTIVSVYDIEKTTLFIILKAIIRKNLFAVYWISFFEKLKLF
ncbi:hypothetical protein RFI_38472, partial [Reticulomyxa filosa]